MQTDRSPGKSLDVLLSIVQGRDPSHLYLKMKVHGYEAGTRTFRFWGKDNPEVIARVIQRSLSGMHFGDESVREVFFHNNRNAPEIPLPDELYSKVVYHLKEEQINPVPETYQRISIQSRIPVVRGI